MSFFLELALIVLGFILGVIWFSVTLLPIFYGFPRSCLWVARGWAKWRTPLLYLITPVIWIFIFFGIALAMIEFLPNAAEYVRSSGGFYVGSQLGILISVGRAIFSKSTRNDMNQDFLEYMRRHLTPKGVKALGKP